MKIKVKTPAKLNLTLEILSKRKDGYHNIKSIMQAISIYDLIEISVKDSLNKENEINIYGNSKLISYDKSNLCYISTKKFFENSKLTNKKVNIYIYKNIPIAAGLAGGSSNAAGVLVGLNKIFNNILDNKKLSEIASSIGADVNFCLQGGTQVAISKGEVLEKINTPDLNFIVLKKKNIYVSTKDAYQKYSELYLRGKTIKAKSSEPMIKAVNSSNILQISSELKNDFEKVILPDYPILNEIKEKLICIGCLNSLMSGSGPSIFGIYKYDQEIDLSQFNESFDIFKAQAVPTGIRICKEEKTG